MSDKGAGRQPSESAAERARTAERRERIHALVLAGETRVDELSLRLGVSASTVRRDLARLTGQGRIARTYGGALATPHEPEPSLRERARIAQDAKDAIARLAATLVGAGDTALLDAGTTTGRLAHHLRDREDIRVVTNGATAALELLRAEGVELVWVGGTFRRISESTVGPLAEQVVRRISADQAFLGADGLVAGRGICEADLSQTALKELMAARAREVYVLADASKLGHAPFDAWAPLDRPWTLITDAGATPDQLAAFRADPLVEVVVAEAT
jgi:DeoR/GlpR family transcriptional regulator of sugar metabolism